LITWNHAVQVLRELDQKLWAACGESLLEVARKHPNPAIRYFVAKAEQNIPTARESLVMLGAVTTGLSTFVRRSGDTHLHPVESSLWNGDALLAANPVAAALTGRFVLAHDILPGYAVEKDFANTDLYVREKEFRRLFGLRGGSDADLERKGRRVIDEFVAGHPHGRLAFREFLAQIHGDFPSAGEARVKRIWQKLRPRVWAKGGRPPRRNG
jgi:hypothetical protein